MDINLDKDTPQGQIINYQLASRFKRFSASLLNWSYWGIFVNLCLLPFLLISFIFEFKLENTLGISIWQFLIIYFIPTVLFIIIQIIMMHKYSQTLGKRVVGIKVVDYKTGECTKNVKLFFREALPLFVWIIPYIGIVLFALDIILLFITKSRRTLTDQIFGTIVVKDN